MSECTHPGRADGQSNVTALFTDVVLDGAAIQAQRLALLAELTAEQLGSAYVGVQAPDAAARLAAVGHLEQAARLARQVAERERARCVVAYGRPGQGCRAASAPTRGAGMSPSTARAET